MEQQTNLKGINLDDVISIHSYQPGANQANEPPLQGQVISEEEVRDYIKLEA